MPLQKGHVKNSRAGLNMGSKLDIEQIRNLEVQLFSLNEWKTLDWIVFSVHDLALSALCLCWNSSTGTSDSCGSSRATSSHCLEGEKELALTPPNWKGKNTIFFIVGSSCVKDLFSPLIIPRLCRFSSRLLPQPFVIIRCYSFYKLLLQNVLTWFVVAVQSACWTSTGALYLSYSFTSWSLCGVFT